MEPHFERRPPLLFRVLAGLEVGVWAGLAMLAWLALGSLILRQSVWTVPDVLSALLFHRAVPRGFSLSTLPGLAFHLFVSGMAGILFAFIAGDVRSRLRVRLLGLLTGLVWYYVSYGLLWRRLGPTGALYVSPAGLLGAHLIFGAVLGWYPGRLRAVLRQFGAPVPAGKPAPVGGPAASESRAPQA